MDRLEKAARALVDELDRMFEDGERGILFEREFRALRSALPPAPGGGEAPVAWAVRSADGQVWAVMHGHYAEREAESWRETWACTHTLRAPYTVAPLYAHPTPAPLGGAEKALADLVARLDAYADSEPSEPISAITRWPEWDAACKAHRAARTA